MADGAYDAVVVGAGPNGLAAAITLAEADRSVLLVEAGETVGGGTRSAELTLPGFVHDVCSAIHPLVLASPFMRSVPLERHGLELVHPDVPLAHPLDDGTAVVLERSVEATAARLGSDGAAYRRLMSPVVRDAEKLIREVLGPARPPHHPFALAAFGLRALRSAVGLAGSLFGEDPARALFGGIAAHGMLRLDQIPSSGVALLLGLLAHAVGWPAARGGSQRIADALRAHLESLGGEVETGRRVESVHELPSARVVLFNVTPRQLLSLAGERLPSTYRRQLERYRYGPGVFKMDWALDGPVPWKADDCGRAGTVHVGGTLPEMAEAEEAVSEGRHPNRPYVLLAQQSAFDATRAPEGKHTLWAYCHVPNGSTVDMSDAIESQIERFAPGFRDRILHRSKMSSADLERHNPNYLGGDINGGLQDLRQLFTRPALRFSPYTTPDDAIYICSSSTPPGGGVHGMCGHFAARAALKRALR